MGLDDELFRAVHEGWRSPALDPVMVVLSILGLLYFWLLFAVPLGIRLGRRAALRMVLLLLLDAASAEAECPEAHSALLRLLGADACAAHDLAAWVSAWGKAYDAGCRLTADPALAPERRAYYLKGFQALLEAGQPHAILLALLDTWDQMVSTLESFADAESHRPAWDTALATLGLTQAAAPRRLQELESYLDHLEAFLESWSTRHGA